MRVLPGVTLLCSHETSEIRDGISEFRKNSILTKRERIGHLRNESLSIVRRGVEKFLKSILCKVIL